MLLSCFSGYWPGMVLLKTSVLTLYRGPASGATQNALEMVWHLQSGHFCKLEPDTAAKQRRTEEKELTS